MMHNARYPYCRGVSGLMMVELVRSGTITNLARWAEQHGLAVSWVYDVARRLERQGMITIQYLPGRWGHPCLVQPGPQLGPISEEMRNGD